MSYVESYFDWLGERCLAQYQQEQEQEKEQIDNNTKNGALKDAAVELQNEESSAPNWLVSFRYTVGGT